MGTYPYDSINSRNAEIRVLTVLPPKDGNHNSDPIECSLSTVLLHEADYITLSYTWGSPYTVQDIRINGHVVQITGNLEAALHQLRRHHAGSRMWIDALCINQQDDLEKSEQVKMMRDIYESATSVIAWLGPAADDSDVAMESLSRLGKASADMGLHTLLPDDFVEWAEPSSSRLRNIKRSFEGLSDETLTALPSAAFFHLSSRNYWTRVWVVQEVAVAAEVSFLCGSIQLSFLNYAAAVIFVSLHISRMANLMTSDVNRPAPSPELITLLTVLPSAAWSALIGIRRRYQGEFGSPKNLLDLLTSSYVVGSSPQGVRQATNPRDRIYGLLSIASDRDALGITTDYSLTPQQVYVEATRKLIENGHISLLSWCQAPKSLPDLPSWVPDFTGQIRESCCDGSDGQKPYFAASGSTTVKLRDEDKNQYSTISLAGVTVDRITTTGSAWTPGLDSSFDYSVATTLLREVSAFCSSSPMSSTLHEAHWRIPCADLEYTGSHRRRATARSAAEAHALILGFEEMSDGEQVEVLRNPLANAYRVAMTYQFDRRPFMSLKGYVGLVPARALPGDVVVILDGVSVPYVLRKVDAEGGSERESESGIYSLVGEAYVYGIMDGEFMKAEAQGGEMDEREWFRLC